ncbi:hypothetical protein ABH926_004888 [Catenulispora sp. GP43]|uniref:glycoside hydrolase family 113 n=1 Tax=Catenulispora sp. GP43 TaxID=3156263 RepID=UPI003517DEAF
MRGERWMSPAVRSLSAVAAVFAAAAVLATSGCGQGSGSGAQTKAPATKAPEAQLGVDVYWHTPTDPSGAPSAVAPILNYVIGLHANSVALAFPIFTDGARPTRVYTDPASTPDPATLGALVAAAKARGLRVTVRPLIDETNISVTPNQWRGSIAPVDTGAWFASYRSVLDPYLDAAQSVHADEFVLGAELNSLIHAPQWQDVYTDAAARFHGELSYADNWDTWVAGVAPPAIPVIGVDAYPPVDLPDSATVDQLTAAWTAWLQHRSAATLAETVIQEVGIPAQPGTYKTPYVSGVSGAPIDPTIQRNWFAAACQSARSLGMPGLYYWSVDSTDPLNGHSDSPGSFVGRGDSAIKECFANPWNAA